MLFTKAAVTYSGSTELLLVSGKSQDTCCMGYNVASVSMFQRCTHWVSCLSPTALLRKEKMVFATVCTHEKGVYRAVDKVGIVENW
jgi:hypothetical protein